MTSALGSCPPDVIDGPSLSADQLIARATELAGTQVTVRGSLVKSGAECTEIECEKTCCNTCSSTLTIATAQGDDAVRLDSAGKPGLYLCRGDESQVCCLFQARGQEVIAQGTFQATPNIEPPVYQLFTTELCAAKAREPASAR